MNLTLNRMRQCAHQGVAAMVCFAALAAGSAHAGNVGISVGIHVPGAPVYVMPPPPPPPRVHYYHPAPPPVVYYAPAPHGYWAPPPPRHGHGKHFKHRSHKHGHPAQRGPHRHHR